MPENKMPCDLKRMLILLGIAAGVSFCAQASADELDPFQVDRGHWMSFERYSDNIKHNRSVTDETISTPVAIEAPASDAATAPQATTTKDSTSITEQTATAMPPVAAPMRALDLPILPGINKGYGIHVDSTLDNTNSNAPTQIVNTDEGKTDLHLQEQNWQDAAEIARQHADDSNGIYKDSERLPLDVRMTFLPNPKITPEPSPERKPRVRLAEVPTTRKTAPVAKPQTAPAECAALDAYKKKQLEAIQSDRKTLQALQSAISDLGLQKQLNFMTGAQQSSTLNTSAANVSGNPSATTTGTP